MKLILVASMALAAYLVSSALRTSITTMRSWLRLKGAYSSRSCASAAGLSVPMMMRSGRLQSATAAPSFRNSGLLTTSKAMLAPRSAKTVRTASATLSAVPTGTVDLLTMVLGAAMWVATVRATASTCCKSALPSSSGGVPTARKISLPCATPSAASVVKRRRPAAWLASTMGARPGSWMGIWPARSAVTLAASMSTHTTSCPTSASTAP